MLNRFFGTNFHTSFHLFGISAFAVGLPTSKVILSLASMLLLLNLLLEADFKVYWKNIRSNRLLFVLFAFWSLHLITLLWTEDFAYASNDIRIKVTLLLIPLILVAKPIQLQKQLLLTLGFFLASLLVTSVYNYSCYNHWIGNHVYDDIRGLSLFGSHIRYGILVAMGAGISIYYFQLNKGLLKFVFLVLFCWFSYYTYYSQIISGVVALLVVIMCYVLFIIFNYSKRVGWISIGAMSILFILSFFLFFSSSPNDRLDSNYLALGANAVTESGNSYTPLFNADGSVNKKPIFINVCEPELNQEWKKRSNYNIDGLNFQLRHNENPNGHSLLQRIAYWKAGIEIIKQNWLFGVGTGDVQSAFDAEYERSHSLLLPENRLRAHNSYLTSWISFGILGITFFLLMIFLYLKWQVNQQNLIGIMFILVAMSTFLIEDTLETQMGVSFFAFFYGMFASKRTNSLS